MAFWLLQEGTFQPTNCCRQPVHSFMLSSYWQDDADGSGSWPNQLFLVTVSGIRGSTHLVLDLMQIGNYQHLALHILRADQLPRPQLCSSSETRLHGTQDQADCKGWATSDHLLGKQFLEGFAEGAGDGLQSGVD